MAVPKSAVKEVTMVVEMSVTNLLLLAAVFYLGGIATTIVLLARAAARN